MLAHRGGFRRRQSGKDAQTRVSGAQNSQAPQQSFLRGPLHPGFVAHGLAVIPPLRRTRPAAARMTDAQTIQYSLEML
ncbi:MAG: hypothetical protein KDJ16_13470 [Hyphomicrobiales bacterium]|nr:hypothetical protein [Hyphomicrobiales bacterium]